MARKKISSSAIIVAILCLVAFYFTGKTIVTICLPFIIAYLLSKLTEPLMKLLSSYIRLPKSFSALVCTLLVVALFCLICFGAGSLAVTQIQKLSTNWESISAAAEAGSVDWFSKLPMALQEFFVDIPTLVNDYATKLLDPLFDMVGSIVTNTVSILPGLFVSIIVTFLACYFMSRDREAIVNVYLKLMGSEKAKKISSVLSDVKGALGGYIKTQLTLMLIMFIILSVGLGVFAKTEYFFILAFAIAILDALPVFGSGFVLNPWGVWMIIQGEYKTGITLIVLYLVILLTRQILEPRILGKQIGIHPLVTIVSMYAGLKILGVFGMILGPVIAVIIKNLYVAGVFDKWKGKES